MSVRKSGRSHRMAVQPETGGVSSNWKRSDADVFDDETSDQVFWLLEENARLRGLVIRLSNMLGDLPTVNDAEHVRREATLRRE